jgi:Xaa-Pro aminopeptidase
MTSVCLFKKFQHGTGHGFGSFLTVHEGPHGFASGVPLVPGHVITNEPGFCMSPLYHLSLFFLDNHMFVGVFY